MPSLREYLRRRRGEIRAESERLAQQRDKLQGQLHVLRARLDELDRESMELGRVDGFDDDEAEGESHEGSEVLVGFLATERDALEALELADQLLDAGAGAVERLRKESGPVSGRGLERDHRADAPFARGRAVGLAVVSFVPHRSPRRDVRPEVKQ